MMASQINRFFNYLLANSHSKWSLLILQKVINNRISFNASHKFKFIELSQEITILVAPFIRANKNHLGGVHACAIATVGEYTAGLCLVKNFGLYEYRIIMEELQVSYIKQATGAVSAKARFSKDLKAKIIKDVATNSQSSFELTSRIENTQGEEVANVTTKWQLKDWKKVTFKV